MNPLPSNSRPLAGGTGEFGKGRGDKIYFIFNILLTLPCRAEDVTLAKPGFEPEPTGHEAVVQNLYTISLKFMDGLVGDLIITALFFILRP